MVVRFCRLVGLVLLLLGAPLAWAQDAPDAPPPRLPENVVSPDVSVEELMLRINPLTRDELARAAAIWRAIVKKKTEQVVEDEVRILSSKTESRGAEEQAARKRLAKATVERAALFAKYSVVIDAWARKGGDEAAVEEYRLYRDSILLEEARTADAETLSRRALDWLADRNGGLKLLLDAAVIVAALFGLFLLARLVRRFARKALGRVPNLSMLLQAFLVMVVYWLTIATGLMVVLSALGVDVTPLFALVGGASFIMAFAMQETLGNLAAGLMIMINRPFDVGDYVDVGGVSGTVKSVSIVSTKVTTPDNQVIVIPNSSVWGNVITNVTSSATRRVDLVFGIGYGDSIEDAQRIMAEAVAAHPLVLADPEPNIRVHELADNSVNFICRPWVRSEDYWSVYWDLTRAVKERFDAGGVSIPFPQRDVHLHHATPAPQAALAAGAAVSVPGQGAEAVNDEGADQGPGGGAEGDEDAR